MEAKGACVGEKTKVEAAARSPELHVDDAHRDCWGDGSLFVFVLGIVL